MAATRLMIRMVQMLLPLLEPRIQNMMKINIVIVQEIM
nr:MAG TPA: hypothetical protein [Caudoviricetes sp.]